VLNQPVKFVDRCFQQLRLIKFEEDIVQPDGTANFERRQVQVFATIAVCPFDRQDLPVGRNDGKELSGSRIDILLFRLCNVFDINPRIKREKPQVVLCSIGIDDFISFARHQHEKIMPRVI
jgi:hypothetical protein